MNISKIINHDNNITQEIYENGGIKWYKNGELHKDDGPAVEWEGNYKAWYKNGKLHREDGAALQYPGGRKIWYKNGKKHRLDGPAVENPHGVKEYWIDDKQIPEQEFNALQLSQELLIKSQLTKKMKI